MKAIILAAGESKRLKSLTKEAPKCLLKVSDKSILEYQLEALRKNGITEVVFVVGFLPEKIREKMEESYSDFSVEYVLNENYSKTNTIYSLNLATEFFGDGFIYLNADVLFHERVIGLILKNPEENVLAVEFKKCGEEEVKVTLADGKLQRIGKEVCLEKSVGEFIGVAKFSGEFLEDFKKSLEQCSKENPEYYFEEAIDRAIVQNGNFGISIENISDYPVIEIDFPEDLEKAKKEVVKRIDNYDK